MKKAFLTTRLNEAVKKEIERIAKEERRSVSQVTEMLLEQALKARKNGSA